MVKLSFSKRENCPDFKLELYKGTNPIPFSISIGNVAYLPSTIYSRNMYDGGMVEYRFDERDRKLYEITLVVLRNIKCFSTNSMSLTDDGNFYDCKLCNKSCEQLDTEPMIIQKGINSITISFLNHEVSKYFKIAVNVFIGVSVEGYLAEITLDNLLDVQMKQIFGFV